MTKQEAMEFLGISKKTLERYVTKGMIKVSYIKGKTNNVGIYDEQQLIQLKEQLAQPIQAPAIARPQKASIALSSTASIASTAVQALVPAAATVFDVAPETRKEVLFTVSTVRASVQLALTLEDAAMLTRLSRQYLSSDIKAGKLKAAKRGRGWHIKRSDLEAYVATL